MDYMNQQKANRERKRQARASIYQQAAGSLRAPTYNVQAARVNHANAQANQNFAGDAAMRLGSYFANMGGGGEKQPDWLAQDYQNNPQFAGKQMGRAAPPPEQQRPGASSAGDWTGEKTGELARQGNELTGFENTDEALNSIGVF